MNSLQIVNSFKSEGIPDETLEKFFEYHRANPCIWEHFEKFALRVIAKRKKIGAKGIMERVRWEVDIEDDKGESAFKINNNFPAYYARIFHLKYPQFNNFFETREIKGLHNGN